MLRIDCSVMAMVLYLVVVSSSASAQSLATPDMPYDTRAPGMPAETAGALLALIDHILTPAMVSNLNDDGSGMLNVRKCPLGCCMTSFEKCVKCNPEDETYCD